VIPVAGTACRSALTTTDAIERHNIAASFGERSYLLVTNVTARTVEAKRTAQGSGVHAAKGHQ
jgi:hypothetical protein